MEERVTMEKLFYKPEHAWVGDLIPYWEDGIFYGFYLHDPRIKDKEYAEETTWHLVTTKDFVNLEYKGEAIKRGGDDKPNKNIYTGSVIKDKDGIYHAFYTAYNADIKINGKSVQSVMQATGTDPLHLETKEDFLFVADGVRYEEFDWRDPYVFWNEEEGCYYMLLAARHKDGGQLRGGCVALCKSEDLDHWSYEEPFYAPNMYVTMECPEVFRMGDYWYLVYSTFSDRFTTHYRISKSLKAVSYTHLDVYKRQQKTLGVVGTGRIGQGVVRRCRGFDMQILCYDIYENEAFKKECNARYVDLDTLLKESDFITIHSPLTPETQNMIGAREFDMMKNDAVIVNTARGGIIDEEALYEALKSGSIRGAGLDATVDEPPYDSPLMTLPNCILTPHAGAATKEASSKMSLMAAQNVVDVLTAGDCKYKVN